jgi:alanine dehydrogenase
VLVLGAGVAGLQAIATARRLGAVVEAFDTRPVVKEQVQSLGAKFLEIDLGEQGEGTGGYAKELSEDAHRKEQELVGKHVKDADVVITTALVPGRKAPILVTAEMIKAMKPGSVIVDVAIDQGGCSETSRPTTHSNPTYLVDDVVHYCVTNMPGAVARTSTFALNNMTLPFVLTLAGEGARRALGEDMHLRNGLNVYDGMVTHRAVADALKIKCTPAEAALRL